MPVKKSLIGSVLHVSLNRPNRHNAFNEELLEALRETFESAAARREIRIAVLKGEGNSFCAGADIEWMRHLGQQDEDENRASADRMGRIFHILDAFPKPLVAVVHGACVGGGLGLVATADVVIAERSSFFAASEVRLGILPAVVGPFICNKVGFSRCRELMLTGRSITAREAKEMALVHRVVSGSELEDALREVTGDLLRGGPRAQSHIKRFLRELVDRKIASDELVGWTAAEIARARASEEGRAGLEAFSKKEKPPWVPQESQGP